MIVNCEFCNHQIDLDKEDTCDKCGKSIFLDPKHDVYETKVDKTLLDLLLTNSDSDMNPSLIDRIEISNHVEDLLRQCDPDAIIINGMNEAIIGKTHDGRLVYDKDKMLFLLSKRSELTISMIDEYLYNEFFNKDMGKLSPIFISIHFDLLKLSL